VRLSGATPRDLEGVETCKVKTHLFACRLSTVREWRQVPSAVLSSGISLSSASGSVSDSV